MEYNLIEKGYIPYDKSWIIRMGILDLKNGSDNCIKFLKRNYDDLGEDLKDLYWASLAWIAGEKRMPEIESGTLYRFLRMRDWSEGLDKEFILKGTLKERMEKGMICDNPDIINWSPLELLTLDGGTSQWASASYLLGLTEKLDDSIIKTKEIDVKHPKLLVNYDAVEHWNEKNGLWEVRYDETILTQATAYLDWLRTGEMIFNPKQSEDYCFARGFGIIKHGEIELYRQKWPSLEGHESNRFDEMELALQQKVVTSKDHRVVQMSIMSKGDSVTILHPDAVKKSWPQFPDFIRDSPKLIS